MIIYKIYILENISEILKIDNFFLNILIVLNFNIDILYDIIINQELRNIYE